MTEASTQPEITRLARIGRFLVSYNQIMMPLHAIMVVTVIVDDRVWRAVLAAAAILGTGFVEMHRQSLERLNERLGELAERYADEADRAENELRRHRRAVAYAANLRKGMTGPQAYLRAADTEQEHHDER